MIDADLQQLIDLVYNRYGCKKLGGRVNGSRCLKIGKISLIPIASQKKNFVLESSKVFLIKLEGKPGVC
jgi:hypothetical protein